MTLPVDMADDRYVLLDLFCCAGGASKGYANAGFKVIGVDIDPQPNYPFPFFQMDAMDVLAGRDPVLDFRFFDAVHASPPCQSFTAYRRKGMGVGEGYPDLIGPVRETLEESGLPYVIENVQGAPLRSPVQLCGSSFDLDVRRHRLFESSVPLMVPPCAHGWQTPRFAPATNRTNLRSTVEIGVWRIDLETQKRAMGVDWDVTREELSQMVPPAYTEHIGRQLTPHIARQEVAA